MDAEISPEPSEEERRAILAALARGDGRPAPYRSLWRAAALEEPLGGDATAEDPGRDPRIVEP